MHKFMKRQAGTPSFRFQFRTRKKLADIAKTQVRHRIYSRRQLQFRRKLLLVENTYPADANPLDPRGEPEVLHSQTSTKKIRLEDCVPTQNMGAATGPITGNAEVDRALEYAFELQAAIERRSLSGIVLGGVLILLVKNCFDPLPHFKAIDDDEIPWLHEPDGRRMMRGLQ